MLSTELINLYRNISALANYFATSRVTPSVTRPAASSVLVVSTLFAPAAFIKNKNLVLETPSLATGSHITTDHILTI